MRKLELLKAMRNDSNEKVEFDRVINLIEDGIKNKVPQVVASPVVKIAVDKALTMCGFKTYEPNTEQEIISLG